MMLKILIIGLLVVVANARKYPHFLPVELIHIIETLHEVCFPKHGVTIEDVASYDSSNKDPKMMCYMQCMMLEANWMTPDFVIRYDDIIKTAHPDIKDLLAAAINKCRDVQPGTQDCELAYNFQSCLAEADHEHWFLP